MQESAKSLLFNPTVEKIISATIAVIIVLSSYDFVLSSALRCSIHCSR